MKKATKLIFGIVFAILLGVGQVFAQVTIANDDASNYSNSDYVSDGNLGYGFNSWYTANSDGGYFRGDASDGRSNASILNTGGNAFGLWASGSSDVGRNLQELKSTDTLSFQLSIQWDNGNKGFDLYTGGIGVDQVFNFNYTSTGYTWSGSGTQANTDWSVSPGDRQNGVVLSYKFIQTETGLDYIISALSGDDGFGIKTGSISYSGGINAIKFYVSGAGGGSGGNLYFNNLNVSSPQASISLTNSEGFRLLSSPIATTYSDLLDEVWTQGATGADATNGDPNVYTWNKSSTDDANTNWAGVTDLSGSLVAGNGLLAYIFADDDYDGSGDAFPKTLAVTGSENAVDVAPTLNANVNGWTLVGNPFATTIDFDNTTKNDLTDVAYVWDPNSGEGAWKTWNGSTGDVTDGLVTSFQGFFVQNNGTAASPSITFGEASKGSGGTFLGKANTNQMGKVRLEVTGQNLLNSTWLQFSEEGSANEIVIGDAVELQALSANFAELAVEKTGKLFDIAHLPISEDINLPISFKTTVGGVYTLTADNFDIPSDLSIEFHDYETGKSLELDDNFSYEFEASAIKSKNVPTLKSLQQGPIQAKASNSNRFALVVRPAMTSSNEPKELPSVFALEQNYPNPFNPATTIKYSVAKAGEVQLSVYNMMGQKVANLVSGTKSAGSYAISWNAEGMASGMYFYRLSAAGQTMTRQMTLIK